MLPTTPLPMTGAARAALVETADRLAEALATPSVALDAGAADALVAIRAALARAVVVDAPGIAVVGRRVTVREPDGRTRRFALVLPGDGDADRNWESTASPLGRAVTGRRAGQALAVDAPGGTGTATLIGVEETRMLVPCRDDRTTQPPTPPGMVPRRP